MVAVIAEAAIGAITLALMLYLAPSRASVFANPTRPYFAEE